MHQPWDCAAFHSRGINFPLREGNAHRSRGARLSVGRRLGRAPLQATRSQHISALLCEKEERVRFLLPRRPPISPCRRRPPPVPPPPPPRPLPPPPPPPLLVLLLLHYIMSEYAWI